MVKLEQNPDYSARLHVVISRSRPVAKSADIRDNRDFKQSTTAGATTAAVTKKVWGEYVAVVC